MKTLVSLVGEQTIPNVLFIKERTDCDQYLFLSTESMERKGKSKQVIQATGLDNNRCRIIRSDENVPQQILESLREVEISDEDSFIVNLTGGTKIMSLAAYTFFSSLNSQMYYLPVGRNMIHKIFPLVRNIETPLQFRLSLHEYLTANGIDVAERNWNKKNELLCASDRTKSLFEVVTQPDYDGSSVRDILRKVRNNKQYVLTRDDQTHVASFLHDIGFDSIDTLSLTKSKVEYLTGGWFEEYVYSWVQSALSLSDEYIALNLNLKPGNADNEFDVMFVNNNKLYIIECKTGLKDGVRDLFNDTAYKLAAIRKEFGLTARTFLFTLQSLREPNGEFKDKYKRRSAALNVEIFDYTDLTSQSRMQTFFEKLS